MNTSVPVIAIDGPSASGKGTIAARVAANLGYHYLDSGALYRIVGYAADRRGCLDDTLRVSDIALNLNVKFEPDRVILEGEDISLAIRTETMAAAASKVAAMPPVREALLARQRAFRADPGLVAEGRDMGSVVFPDAPLKIFLTASAEERAQRRYKQLMEKGLGASMGALLEDIRQRDLRDTTRSAAPLRKCPDAVEIDTTGQSIDAVVAQVLEHYRHKAPQAPKV